MPARHVVVDGSNIATEGRSLPSLVQLDQAVREFRREFPDDVITVVVDATFGHRIDPSERKDFDEAVAHNEIVSPPAGAIGRGDAFLLRVAEKVGATVLSNDSFQEFHGEHEWLFNNGRLIGGKPVPGVGWIFTPRTPVRGPKSRDSIRDARRAARAPARGDEVTKVQKAIEVATEEAVEPDSPKVKRRRRKRGGAPPADPVNEPLPFIEFVAAHPLGSTVEAEVESFSSHGAFVMAEGLRCYIPLSGLGDPPPRAAKEVLRRGETRAFVLQALDPPRRGIELALAEFAHVSGAPTAETVEEEIKEGAARARPSGRRRGGRGAAREVAAGAVEEAPVPEPELVPAGAPAPVGAGAADGDGPPAKRAGRSRRAAKTAAAATPAPEPDVGSAPDPAPAVTGRRPSRRRGGGEAPPATAAAAEAGPGPPAGDEALTAAGPRKRPARPRAGQPRTVPDAAPTPLPTPPDAVPATKKKAASRKAAAPAQATEPPAPADETAPVRSRRGRKAAGTASAPAGPVGETPDVPVAPVGKKAAPRKAAAKKTAARKAAAAAVEPAVSPATTPADGAATPRRRSAERVAEPVAEVPARRTTRKAAKAAKAAKVGDVDPAVTDAAGTATTKKAAARRSGAKKAAAARAPTPR